MDDINVDGVSGFRFIQGTIDHITQHNGYNIPSSFLRKLIRLNNHIAQIADKFLNLFNEKASKDYDKSMNFLIQKPYPLVSYSDRYYNRLKLTENEQNDQLNVNSPKPIDDKTRLKWANFDEDESDKCFKEMNFNECKPSSSCMKLMLLENDAEDYVITHQILYAYFVKMFKCENVVEKNLLTHGTTLKSQVEKLCSRLYSQYQFELKKINFIIKKSRNADLLMEKMLVCSQLGYMQFLNHTLLTQILSFQKPNEGCFRFKLNNDDGDDDVNVVAASHAPANSAFTSRHLLVDVSLADPHVSDCSVHFSSVVLATLAQYLRLFLDPDASFVVDYPEEIKGKTWFYLWRKEYIQRSTAHWPKLIPNLNENNNNNNNNNGQEDSNNLFVPSFLPRHVWLKIRDNISLS